MQERLITQNIDLQTGSVESKRAQIKEYFLKTCELFEKQFEIFVDESIFYKQPEPLRHQLIFYFGHTATFYINKLFLAKLIDNRINPSYESLFAIGVDEMSWDDLNHTNYPWPSVSQVRSYREEMKQIVCTCIDNIDLSLPITWDDPMWIVMMGIEHERIHIETSSVLHRQLDVGNVKAHEDFNICDEMSQGFPQNELLHVGNNTVRLGKVRDGAFYGWDNEYGSYVEDVADFKASKYLVSCGEFLEFMRDGGYENDAFWSQEGLKWREYTQAKHPIFWICDGEHFLYRTQTGLIALPLNWPAEVNYLEAEAFCNYLAQKLSLPIALPSEAQYRVLRDTCGIENEVNVPANIGFRYASSTPVDKFQHGDFYDVVGNVWQWCATPIDGFDGFKIHPLYDDFSEPTFDGRHNIIKGGSWASTGNEVLADSRYAFRRHFFQHAGFRYVLGSQKKQDDELYYEKDEIISQYCDFHYGPEYLGVENFTKKIAQIASKYALNTSSVLDIGCSVGRASFELGKTFDKVVGIDFSARFIKVAQGLKDTGVLRYKRKIEGEITQDVSITLKDLGLQDVQMDNIEFWQGDACNLKPHFSGYDMIIAINLLDRLYDPRLFLGDIANRLNKDGIFIVASPFTWSSEYVAQEHWLGGTMQQDTPKYSYDTLCEILSDEFTLLEGPFDVEFVIREHIRKFQHTFSKFSIWKKIK